MMRYGVQVRGIKGAACGPCLHALPGSITSVTKLVGGLGLGVRGRRLISLWGWGLPRTGEMQPSK